MTELTVVHQLRNPDVEAAKKIVTDMLNDFADKGITAFALVGLDSEDNTYGARHVTSQGDCFRLLGAISYQSYTINEIIESMSDDED